MQATGMGCHSLGPRRGWEGHNSTPVALGTETEPHTTIAPATGPLPGPLLISNPSLGSSLTSQLYSFECVRVVPDPEKLSREPSATEVAISLLLIGSVLTASRRKAEYLWRCPGKAGCQSHSRQMPFCL